MPLRTIHVQVGDQVFLEEGGEEIGAVRMVNKDHIVIYVEGAGDFTLTGPEIAAVHTASCGSSPSGCRRPCSARRRPPTRKSPS